MKYCQNNESEIIDGYFGQFIGTLLSIGENDGITLSNAFALIEKGWKADLVEPSKQVFAALENLHGGNDDVFCHELAIGDRDGEVEFWDASELLGVGDRALVSSAVKEETKRWAPLNMKFNETRVKMVKLRTFLEEYAHYKKYDFVSVDAEGLDITILRQMELDQLGCRCLCIEHNSLPAQVAIIREYCLPLGFREIGYNAENILLAKV